ncbi:MAG: class I SAM-dependent methyltransferase [Methanotrichaceae archaeon]|nr:class I SAM-dependent methyltransferase [Methanotrichaceae archaeon]
MSRDTTELVSCPECNGKMLKEGDKLICHCGYQFKFNQNIFLIENKDVDKSKFANLYNENYYKCPQYDYTSYRLEKIVALARPNKDKRILDLGCGPGEIAVRCARQGAEVFGIDLSRDALRLSSERSAKDNVVIHLFEFDGEKIPFMNCIFDTIILSDVVEHVEDHVLNNLIEECYRLLKPEGRLLIHTAPTKNILFLARALKIISAGNIDLHSKLITPEYEHLHIRYHDAGSLASILKRNGFYPIIWGEIEYLKDNKYVRSIRRLGFIYDQLWCLAFKNLALWESVGSRPYLLDAPSELKVGINDSLYMNYGLYDAENGFRWTSQMASMFIRVPRGNKISLELFAPRRNKGKLYLGRHQIARFELEEGQQSMSFPLNRIEPGVHELRLKLDKTFNPKKEGISEDKRDLGVMLFGVRAD